MEISTFCLPFYKYKRLKKLFMVIKLTTLLIIIGCLHLSAAVFSQNINMSEKNIRLESVFSKLEQQTGYTFFYNTSLLKNLPNVNVDIENGTLEHVLDKALANTSLTYSIVAKTVVIKLKPGKFINIFEGKLISGTVVDEKGEPLPGVTIKLKGGNGAWTTDSKGRFMALVMLPDAVLQFSFIGYLTQELHVKDVTAAVTIKMKEDVSQLDQVQILAYGTTSKRLNTGDVTTITAKQIENSPVPNVLQALQDQVPGLFITQNTGMPGGSFTTQIRPGSTFGTGNPLYIVDGVTYPANTNLPLLSNYVNGTVNGPLRGGSALSYLNPNDIASVTVLKDADATAIYGNRGAYGVIIITTKKGTPGVPNTPEFNANVYSGITVRGTSAPLLNTQQYLMLRNEAFKNDGATPAASDKDVNGTWPTDRYTDWQKFYTGSNAATTNANLSYMGGNGYTNFRIGGNYVEQKSVQIGTGDDKSGGLNFDINNVTTNKKFSIDLSGNYTTDVNTMIPFDFSGSSGVLSAPNAPPVFLPDGSLNWETGSNPAAAINTLSTITTNNLVSTLLLNYKPVTGLTLNTTIGYNLLNGKEFRAKPTSFFAPGTNAATQTNSSNNLYTTRTWNADANADYTHKLGAKGVADVRVGGTLQDVLSNNSLVTGTNFIADALLYNPAAGATVTNTYTQSPSRYIGFFAHANYNWADKYILNLNGRYDGSTKFGPGNQLGAFGSIGAAWIFSEESWFKNHLSFISFGKLRGSIGTVGGDNIANYSYLATYATSTAYLGKSTLLPNGLANPDLNWEHKKEIEGSFTLEFLNGRIGLEGSYYNTRTTHQLITQPLSSVTGFNYFSINSPALIETYGAEARIYTRNIQTKTFSWSTDLSISLPRNKLKAYPGFDNPALTNINYVIGKPITGIKLYNYAGVNPQTGNYNFTNAAGVTAAFLPIVDPVQLNQITDRTQFIDLNPVYYGALNNRFTYKKFSLAFSFNFRSRMGLNFLGQQMYPAGFFNQNTSTIALNRWQKPGDITDVPKVGQNIYAYLAQNNFIFSTGAYSRATYARLQNANLAYAFSGGFIDRLHIHSLSVFARGENLLTISSYKGGLDPENLYAGALPPLRVLTAGLNITL